MAIEDHPIQSPFSESFKVIEKSGDARFGALFLAKQKGGDEGGLHEIQTVSPQLLPSVEVRSAFREALVEMIGAEDSAGIFFQVSGAGVCGSLKGEGDWGGWFSWRRQSGQSLLELSRYVSSTFGADRDAARTWLEPVLAKVAANLDELREAQFPSMKLSLAPEHVFSALDTGLGTNREWMGEPPSKWPGFRVVHLPLGIDRLLTVVLDSPEQKRRLEWLRGDLNLRFASLIYSLFGGRTFAEGTPRSAIYSSALLLSESGNRAIRRCFEHDHPSTLYPTAMDLLVDALRADIKKAPRRADSPLPSSTPKTVQPVAKPHEAKAVEGEAGGGPTVAQMPEAKRKGLGKGVWVGVAGATAAVGWMAFSDRSSAPPAPVPAVGAPVVATAVSTEAIPPAVPAPAPKPPPVTPLPEPMDPADEAKRLLAEGLKIEAEKVLLDAAAADGGAGGRQRAFLNQAYEAKSIKAASMLGTFALASDATEAATYFWQGYLWANDPTAIRDSAAVERCLEQAVSLNHGPAVLEAARQSLQNGDASSATVDRLLVALDAFEKGNAATVQDEARRVEVVDVVKSSKVLTAQLEADAGAAGTSDRARTLFKLAMEAGSATAPLGLAEWVDAQYPQKSAIPAGEMSEMVEALRTGVDRESVGAMLKLAKVLTVVSYPAFPGKGTSDEAKAEQKTLLFRAAGTGDAAAQFEYAKLLLSENRLDEALGKAQGDLERGQILRSNEANLTEARRLLTESSRNGSRGAANFLGVVETMMREVGFATPPL